MTDYIATEIINYHYPSLAVILSSIGFGIYMYKRVLSKTIDFYVSSSLLPEELKAGISIVLSFVYAIIFSIISPEYSIELVTNILYVLNSPFVEMVPAIKLLAFILHSTVTASIELFLVFLALYIYQKLQ